MDENECIFEVIDYRGKSVVFTKAKWAEKKADHFELEKKAFIECLKRAISNPDEVWEDYSDRRYRRCYYKKYSSISYAKVVVWIGDGPCNVITAYEISQIKEAKYPDLRRVR